MREGDYVRVIELPHNLKLNKTFLGKRRKKFMKSAHYKNLEDEMERSFELHRRELEALKQRYQDALEEMFELEELNYRRKMDLHLMAFRNAVTDYQKAEKNLYPNSRPLIFR